MTESTLARAFRENLRRVRDDDGLTQGELSRRLTVAGWPTLAHQTTLARIEGGQRAVRLDEAVALAQALHRSLGTLLTAPPALAAVESLNNARRETRHEHGQVAEGVARFLIVRDTLVQGRAGVASRIEAGEYQGDVSQAAQEALAAADETLALTVESAVQSGRATAAPWTTPEDGGDDA